MNIKINELDNFEAQNTWWEKIRKYNEFKKKIFTSDWNLIWYYQWIYNLLENIQKITKQDPIIHLFDLYKQWLSIKIISQRYNYSDEKLRYLFINIFKWKLRDCNFRTQSWKKRREKNLNISWLKNNWESLHEKTKNSYKNLVKQILESKNQDINLKFDYNYYSNLNWKTRKIIYIISFHFKISINDTFELLKNIKNAWISAIFIAREINKSLKEFFSNYLQINLIISDSDIRYILYNFSYEKYKKNEFIDNNPIINKKSEYINNKFILKISLKRIQWIKSKEELFKLIENTPESSKSVLINRIEKLNNTLKIIYPNNDYIDPIKFLIYLYYEKQLSMWELSKELEKIWIYWPRSSLENNKKLFNWETNTKLKI